MPNQGVRPMSSSGRPLTGFARPGTSSARPGSSSNVRPPPSRPQTTPSTLINHPTSLWNGLPSRRDTPARFPVSRREVCVSVRAKLWSNHQRQCVKATAAHCLHVTYSGAS
jgi:hypothetical protein